MLPFLFIGPCADVTQVAEHCAMLPLALNVVGSLARDDPLEATTWQRLHDELLAKRIELLESEPECAAHVFAVVCAGLCHLSEAQKGQFLLLAVLSPGAIATTDMLANLWDTVGRFKRRNERPRGQTKNTFWPRGDVM